MKNGEGRKTRSDKKRDVKPTIPSSLKECIYRISYITETPVKDISVEICEHGLLSQKVLDHLSQFFKRQIWLNNTLYRGNLDNPSYTFEIEKKERITMRFSQTAYEAIAALAFALDQTPSMATAILLDASIKNTNFIDEHVRKHLKTKLDNRRMRELKKVMEFINENNPYEEEITWSTLLLYIYEDMKVGVNNLSQSVQEWLQKWK